MRVVIGLGGNALLPRGAPPDEPAQVEQVAAAAGPLADLAARHQVVLVHGNGPQVGLLALESAADPSLGAPYPLDDLVAETQGLIGYWLQQALGRHLSAPVVTLVTQTLVDGDDEAFSHPTKFVGSAYGHEEASALAVRHGWTIGRDGAAWRRVVPSPRPREVIETPVAAGLLGAGVTVVLAGGGGVPVVRDGPGLRGVEAVVDKDLTAGLVAAELAADLLVVLTDVPHVVRGFGTSRARPLGETTADELDHLRFPAGSMGPKVEAVTSFVRATGHRGAIGALDDVAAVLAGDAGTQVRR